MLFHRDAFGLPPFRTRTLIATYSVHAKNRAREKRINLPFEVEISGRTVIEIDTDENKYTIRFHHDEQSDIVMVVLSDGFVKTCWLNLKVDQHRTLDKSRYSHLTTADKSDKIPLPRRIR